MSRIPKWKVEKMKVKVVFRLQFQATHIPPGWDKLFLSFIPSDTGKSTAKTTKANVRNGNCKWSDPIYETTRLIQDTRTKKYDEKHYKLVVAMGSSRSSLLGEVNINLADFADALKPSSFQLPLDSCDFGTVLHVTAQLLTSKTGFREFEQQREATTKGFQMISGQRSQDPAAVLAPPFDTANEHIEKVNARVRFREGSTELPSLEEVRESNEDYEDSAAGMDGPSDISDSLYPEKSDISNIHEVDSFRSTSPGDVVELPLGQKPNIKKDNRHAKQLPAQGNNDRTHGWSSDYSLDSDIGPIYEENNRLRVRLEVAESAFLQLKLEARSLQSIIEELGAETQSLTHQLATELASGEELAGEVSLLKSECLNLKNDLEDLKSAKTMQNSFDRALFGDSALASGQNSLSRDGHLKYLQGLLLIEGKLQEIQNKSCLEYHGIGFALHTDLEVLECVVQNLKQGIQKNLGTKSVEDKMCELLERLEESNIEKESLTRKMDQMECYYEALVQDLEVSHKQTLNDLENVRAEHTSCLYTISSLQSQTEKMHQDMNEQLIRFSEDRHIIDSLNKELEQRAIASESALKRVRWNYSIAVDRLQKDLELLSFQVMSMYETNENLAKQVFTDTSQLLQHPSEEQLEEEKYMPSLARTLPEIVKFNSELPPLQNGVLEKVSYKEIQNLDFNEANKGISQTSVPLNGELLMLDEGNTHGNGLELEDIKQAGQEPLDDRRALEELKLSLHMLKELHSNSEFELSEMHMYNMHLEVFSQVLQETLRGLNDGVGYMKDQMNQLKQHLVHSTDVNESLMLRLHSALDEVRLLRENETKFTCDDLSLKNHILEAKIQDLLEENTFFAQKVAESERLLVESRAFESKYKACNEERDEFKNLLKQESLRRSHLESEISSLTGDLKTLEEQLDDHSSVNDGLQRTLNFLQGKLGDLFTLMVSYKEQINSSTLDCISLPHELESKNYVTMALLLEQFHKEAYRTIFQLREEKKEIEVQRNMAQYSLNQTESNVFSITQKFESELKEITTKLDVSSIVSEKLHLELQDVAEKLRISSRAEEKQTIENRELLSKLTELEVSLQHAIDENRDLAQKLQLLEDVNEELERTQLTYIQDADEKLKIRSEAEERHTIENRELLTKLTELEVKLQHAIDESRDLAQKLQLLEDVNEELERTKLTYIQDVDEKLRISSEAEEKHTIENRELLTKLTELEVKLQHATDENRVLVQKLQLLEDVNEELERTKLRHIHDVAEKLRISSEAEEKLTTENRELLTKLAELEVKLLHAMNENRALVQKLQLLEDVNEELERTRSSYIQENKTLMISIQRGNEASIQMEDELSSLKESLGCTHDKLQTERRFREEFEAEVADLTSQLRKNGHQLLSFDEQKAELVYLRKKLLELETENTGLEHLLSESEESQRKFKEQLESEAADLKSQINETGQKLLSFDEQKAQLVHLRQVSLDLETENFQLQHLLSQFKETKIKLEGDSLFLRLQVAEMENHLAEFLENSVARDVEVAYMKSQFQYRILELIGLIETLEIDLKEIHLSRSDIAASLKVSKASESQLVEANKILSAAVQLLKSERDAISCENDDLVDKLHKINTTLTEFEGAKARASTMEADISGEKQKYADEICQLKKEVESLWSSRVEIEITNIILRSNLDEQQLQISDLEICDYELRKLREQHDDLSYKLSQQILKTEEFKNLSVHLRELKDKRDNDGPSHVVQESLRIAFIKEQHETKLQELRSQVFVSKKYAEEMLLKLQNALNDAESAKKNENFLAKKNEELDDELHIAVTDRRELVKACDRLKAELECTILSLDCCKEEKLKLEDSMQECNEERTKIRVELDLLKRLLENMASVTDMHAQRDLEPGPPNTTSIEQILGDDNLGSTRVESVNAVEKDNHLDESRMSSPCETVEDAKTSCVSGSKFLSLEPNSQSLQDGFLHRSALEQETLSKDTKKQNIHIKAHLEEQQRLKTGMDLLLQELEKLKNDNLSSLIPLEENHYDPALQGLERELTQLDVANEHLGSIFPSFRELPVNGNSLERVLALELELAEALQAKKKPDARFQSSFLKQHNDEEAVYQSFRDINDLIKDTLETRRRHTIIETELKEMQDRYSQLSLQFAEVEGERQKLVMTLKNRPSRRS